MPSVEGVGEDESEPMVGRRIDVDEAEEPDASLPRVSKPARQPRCCRRISSSCCILLLWGPVVAYALVQTWWAALPTTSPIRVWPRQFAASSLFNTLLQPSDTRRRSREYFAAQLPLIEESARRFQCLDYWCKNLAVPSIDTTWYELITHRYINMAAKLRANPRADDFRFEKNKCDMYDWFELNGFSTMRTIFRWSSHGEWGTTPVTQDAVVSDLLQNKTGHAFPMFLKTCHITQGWAHSTKLLRSYSSVVAHREELEEWVASLWGMHADDWERPWAKEHNQLTDTLHAGSMVQVRNLPRNLPPFHALPRPSHRPCAGSIGPGALYGRVAPLRRADGGAAGHRARA